MTNFNAPENKTMTLKGFISEKGLEFMEIKDIFNTALRNGS